MEMILWIGMFVVLCALLVLLFILWEHKRYPITLPSYRINHPLGDGYISVPLQRRANRDKETE